MAAVPSTCTCRAAPLSLLQTGDRLTGGDIFGLVHENTLIDHKIMVQPGAQGTVSWIAPQGEYTLTDKVLELEFAGNKKVSRWLAWTRRACKGLGWCQPWRQAWLQLELLPERSQLPEVQVHAAV